MRKYIMYACIEFRNHVLQLKQWVHYGQVEITFFYCKRPNQDFGVQNAFITKKKERHNVGQYSSS